MSKKVRKLVSAVLTLALILSMVPSVALTAAASSAAELLTRQLVREDVSTIVYAAYNDAAVIESRIDILTGEKLVNDDEYGTCSYILQYTPSGLKRISDYYNYININATLRQYGYTTYNEGDGGTGGVIRADGTVVLESKPDTDYYYYDIVPYTDEYLKICGWNSVDYSDIYMYLNINTGEITSITPEGLENQEVYTVESIDGNSVVKDSKGNVTYSGLEYTYVSWYNDLYTDRPNLAIDENSNYGYLDVYGNVLIPFMYNYANDFTEGYAVVRDEDWNYGYIDVNGNAATPMKYDYAYDFNNGYAIVRIDGKYGYIDMSGNEVTPIKYDSASAFDNGYAIVQLDGKYGIIDTNGNELYFSDQYISRSEYSGLFFNGNGLMIDATGRTVLPSGFSTSISNTGLIWRLSYDNTTLEVYQLEDVSDEYVYDTADPAEDMALPTEALDKVTNTATATSAVNTLTSGMTAAQKTSATGADLATLYAETAVSKAASKEVSGSDIIINAAAVKELETTAASTAQAVETALVNGGVSTGRYIANTVTLTTEQTGKITIKVDPDILTTKVDKIRVETPKYALTLKVSDLAEDLTNIVTISAESMDVSDSGSYALGGTAGASSMRTVVALDLPGGHTTNSVTLSFPSANSSGANEAVVNESGAASASKYNPATVTMDGKVNTSGKYTVKSNEKDFTDIASKSAEMQNAIRYLASKGIINGTSETTFSPDGSISRAEIAALIVRALGKLDSTATANFKDVTTADWYYTAAASSQKNGIINGYSDNTFKGKNPIIKQEIVAVAARVLKNEMNYKEPTNTQTYLAKYSDTVAGWAQPEVALATRENLIVYRVDGTFSGAKNMTRGDAAIIIYRLFQHIW